MRRRPLLVAMLFLGLPQPLSAQESQAAKAVAVVVSAKAHPRIRYGADQLAAAIGRNGGRAQVATRPVTAGEPGTVWVGTAADGDAFAKAVEPVKGREQAFSLTCRPGPSVLIAGVDESGALYGCLELTERIEAAGGRLPESLDLTDSPKLTLRGPCIGLQRPETGSDGVQYIFPYLPRTFPWFYDKDLWRQYLDLMVRYRFNTLYLWNGHPFTSILKLPKYPEAQEVDTPQLEANIELFNWLCTEADRRGIWVVQNFYNIHLSHAFARHHKIEKVHRKPTPLVSEYTAHCIGEFIKNYPHVGLMMCLGEALDDRYDAQWLTEVIIPAVKTALKPGQPPPPIIVRSHATPIFDVLAKAQPLYPNIYTEAKYNNETLACDQVGGGSRPDVTRHYAWEAGGQGHRTLAEKGLLITNVHCVANLEPFRWGSPDFVRRAMTSCVETGVKGLHLYPLRYWEWPYSADRTDPRLLQPDRDWIWFAAWARYAWNPAREKQDEDAYWTRELARKYGSADAGRRILAAYERSGEVMPHIVRAFAVTTENYQATTMGMTLPQLVESKRWYAPYAGETIAEYAKREAAGLKHEGETPLDAARAIVKDAEAALLLAEGATPWVTTDKAEFARLLDDLRALRLVARHYATKVAAAITGLVFLKTRDGARLDQCEEMLAQSVEEYRQLAALTARTYRDCAGRHDAGRRYPYPAPQYLVWSDMLPEFEKELEIVRHNAGVLRKHKDDLSRPDVAKRLLSDRMFTERLTD